MTMSKRKVTSSGKRPSYQCMIIDALSNIESNVCSFVAIAKAIEGQYPELLDSQDLFRRNLKNALKKSVDAGTVKKIKQSFKLSSRNIKSKLLKNSSRSPSKSPSKVNNKRTINKRKQKQRKRKNSGELSDKESSSASEEEEEEEESLTFWVENEVDSSPYRHESGTESDIEYRKKIKEHVKRRLSFDH